MKPLTGSVSRPVGKTGLLVSAILLSVAFLLLPVPRSAWASERTALVTVSVNLASPPAAETVRLWMPYPMSDGNQEITDIRVDGNFTHQGVYREGDFGNPILFAEWKNVPGKRTMTYAFRVVRKELVTRSLPEKELSYSREEFRKELAPAAVVPTDGPVEELAGRITAGEETKRGKGRGGHHWVRRNNPPRPATPAGGALGAHPAAGGTAVELLHVPVCGGGRKTDERGSLRVQPRLYDPLQGAVTGGVAGRG